LNLTGVAFNKPFHGWQFLQNYLYAYWPICRAA
jgi:hypothetical protein